jgi:hypothetical protein
MAIKFKTLTVDDWDFPLLSEKVDETFEITQVDFKDSPKGKYALVYVYNSVPHRTSSKVILQQLEAIQKALLDSQAEGDPHNVEVTLRKNPQKSYLFFE